MSKLKKKVQVIVFRKAFSGIELLLLQTNERRGYFWQNITGSVDQGETYEKAALREFAEETGVESRPEKLIKLDLVFNFKDRWGKQAVEKCFVFILNGRFDIIIDPDEHSDFRWIPLDQVQSEDYQYPSNYEAFQLAKNKVLDLI